ncbi:MAG: hypothetical protein PHS22_17055, partial [Rhodoferax sp.]|nr:hypothetical protein [Rhodoferax sp.]
MATLNTSDAKIAPNPASQGHRKKKTYGTINKTPNQEIGRFQIRSLTMTYFHTGIRTIIGAEAFHGPVRDG